MKAAPVVVSVVVAWASGCTRGDGIDRTLVTGNAKDARAPEPWQFMIHPQPPTDVQRWVDNITRWAELSEGHGSRSDAP